MTEDEKQELWERGRKSYQVDLLIKLAEELGEHDPAVETILADSVMHLFNHQAVTISKSECDVRIQCNRAEDANALFEWLSLLGSKYVQASK